MSDLTALDSPSAWFALCRVQLLQPHHEHRHQENSDDRRHACQRLQRCDVENILRTYVYRRSLSTGTFASSSSLPSSSRDGLASHETLAQLEGLLCQRNRLCPSFSNPCTH